MPETLHYSWWFQCIWKICSSNWIISPGRGENEKYLKPPPSLRFTTKFKNCTESATSWWGEHPFMRPYFLRARYYKVGLSRNWIDTKATPKRTKRLSEPQFSLNKTLYQTFMAGIPNSHEDHHWHGTGGMLEPASMLRRARGSLCCCNPSNLPRSALLPPQNKPHSYHMRSPLPFPTKRIRPVSAGMLLSIQP